MDTKTLEKPRVATGTLDPKQLQAVMEYQHPGLVERLQGKLKISEDEATLLFDDTKRFLWMCGVTSGESFSPSPKIDEGWHNFILFTKEYGAFCHKFFGRFIHHVPRVKGQKENPIGGKYAIERTFVFAQKAFGSLSENWAYPGLSSDCGGCGKPTCCEKCSGTTNDLLPPEQVQTVARVADCVPACEPDGGGSGTCAGS